MQLAISTLITIRLSCTRSIALKSSILKVIGSMLGTQCQEIMLMNRTCRRCLFRAEAVVAPPAKSLAMVFRTRLDWSRGLSSLYLERLWFLHLSNCPTCSRYLP